MKTPIRYQVKGEKSLFLEKRVLTDYEISEINEDIKGYPDLAYISIDKWKNYDGSYVLTDGKEFMGVCILIIFRGWVKIGPIVIRKRHLGKGYGRKILACLIRKYSRHNIYIGSSNPRIGRIASDEGFSRVSFFMLPWEIKEYLIKALFGHLSIKYLYEGTRKFLKSGRGKFVFYIK